MIKAERIAGLVDLKVRSGALQYVTNKKYAHMMSMFLPLYIEATYYYNKAANYIELYGPWARLWID